VILPYYIPVKYSLYAVRLKEEYARTCRLFWRKGQFIRKGVREKYIHTHGLSHRVHHYNARLHVLNTPSVGDGVWLAKQVGDGRI
jgi:hypothetical protein